FQAEDGIRYFHVTGVQTCALPIFQRVAGRAARVQFLAGGAVAAGEGRRGTGHGEKQGRYRAVRRPPHHGVEPRRHHEKKAPGTGSNPSAWRRTAQCMASSARMLAAAADRSRLPNTGMAPTYALT